MKESLVGVVLTGLLALGVLGVVAADPGYERGQAQPFWPVVKRGYWEDPDDPGQPEALQVRRGGARHTSETLQVQDKRGFGSMMPAYLLQLYRPDQPLINPSLLFARSSSGRVRGSNSDQG
ncbi:uncharacterized protein LOC126981092 isoform X1 [Eriocheir sinensis]|uniref:uncharacterized protein LOC126981092 isoform X1 n=1 Tax=Eriocheir sinensis TaxID=95602 RepID=UPI0021C78264|nr:uncharacterized protein LOC126981092 isoform X1 [Eriocheir sinensis]